MSEQKFKDNDEILIRAKIIQTDNSCLPYKIAISDKSTAWLYEDLEDHATLIDPNTPQSGDKVWAKLEEDIDWEEATFIGVDGCNGAGRYVARGEKRGYRRYVNITTTDPRKKEDTINIDGIEYSKETLTNIVRNAHNKSE